MRSALFLVFLMAAASCTHWRRSSEGLLEGQLPIETLAPAGSLGLNRIEIASKQVVLPSGLRLGIEKAPSHGMVGVILTIGAGSAASPEGKDELAHLVEHLVFPSRPGGPGTPSIREQLIAMQAFGFNAETTADVTKFYAFVPADNVYRLIALWASVLEEPLNNITEEDLVYEHAAVQNELREHEVSVFKRARATWVNSALHERKTGRARSFSSARGELSRMSLQEVRAYAKQWYRHPQASLFLIGDFQQPDDIVQHLPKSLVIGSTRPVPLPPVAEEPAPLPPVPEGGIHRYPVLTSGRLLTLAWKLPGPYSSRGYLSRIVTSRASRSHYEHVIYQLRGVGQVAAGSTSSRDSTVLTITLELEKDANVETVGALAATVVQSMWSPALYAGLLPYLEWEAVMRAGWNPGRSMLILQRESAAAAIFGNESFRNAGLEHANFFHETGNSSYFVKVASDVANAAPEALAVFANQWLTNDHCRIVLLEPSTKEGFVFVDEVENLFSPPASAKGVSPLPLGSDVPKAVPPPVELAAISQFHLPNGLQVAIAPRRDYPVVSVALAFNGGTSAGDPPGVVELVRYFETGIYANLQANGLFLSDTARPDMNIETLTTGPKNLSTALYMLASRQKKIDEELDWRFILTPANRHRWNILPPQTLATRVNETLMSSLYPNHPYGRIVSQKDIDNIDSDDAFAWLRRMQSPRNAMLVIVGNVDVPAARKLVESWFGTWNVGPNTFEVAVQPPPDPRSGVPHDNFHRISAADTDSVEVTMACRLPKAQAGDDVRHSILAHLVQTRFFEHLRYRLGASYGPGASAESLRGGAAHMLVRFSLDARKAQTVFADAHALWRRLVQGDLQQADLALGRWQGVSAWNLAFEDSPTVLLHILDRLNKKWPVEELANYPKIAEAVSLAQLKQDLKVCGANTTIVLVGDEKVIAKLGAANVATTKN